MFFILSIYLFLLQIQFWINNSSMNDSNILESLFTFVETQYTPKVPTGRFVYNSNVLIKKLKI